MIAIIAILAALLLPGLARAKQQAQGTQCMSNLKQLTDAWFMYNGDNREFFVPNGGEGAEPTGPALNQQYDNGYPVSQWCPGRQDVNLDLSPGNLPTTQPNLGYEYIQVGLLYPYLKSVLVYKCPADIVIPAANVEFGTQYPHVRSMSMNSDISPLNPPTAPAPWSGSKSTNDIRVYVKSTDLTVPGPVNTWLLIDENPYSINDAYFVADISDPNYWVDCPASYHNNACGLCFTDGHAQIKKWLDKVILPPASTTKEWAGANATAGILDCAWLQSRTSATFEAQSFIGPP